MKILRVISSMNPSQGGPCQGIRYSIQEMEKLGVYNEVVCLNDPSSTFIINDNFPIIALGEGKSPWNYNAKLIPWLMKNILRFDVIIVHGLWLYPSFAVRRAIKMVKKNNQLLTPKLFVMPHGMLDPYFQRTSDRKIKALRNWIYWKLIEEKVVNGADGILFTCEEELKLARKPFRPYHPAKEINVGYGISDPPPFSKSMQNSFFKLFPDLKNKNYFLFLSRIHKKKGLDILISAYAEIWEKYKIDLKKNITSKPPILVIAGPGLESSYGQQIKKLAESITPKNTVFFTGMLSGKAKWGAFYGCEAFILPSHQENFGIAVVEALGCGKPVLISNEVNIWQEIECQGAGIINKDSKQGTINSIKKWMELSLDDRKKMGERALSVKKNHFSIPKATCRLIKAVS